MNRDVIILGATLGFVTALGLLFGYVALDLSRRSRSRKPTLPLNSKDRAFLESVKISCE